MGKKAAHSSGAKPLRKPIKPLPKHKRHQSAEQGSTSRSSTSPMAVNIEEVLDSDAPDDMPPKLQGLVHQVCAWKGLRTSGHAASQSGYHQAGEVCAGL